MKIKFDSKADAIRIKFQEGEYESSKEVDEGVIIDFSIDNKIMAIEILDVSDKISAKALREVTRD